jgi:hypothetical protein
MRRPASAPVSGSVSDQRKAACVGGSRERERTAARGALMPHTFRSPHTPPEHAHTAREPRASPSGGTRFPDMLYLGSKSRLTPMGSAPNCGSRRFH